MAATLAACSWSMIALTVSVLIMRPRRHSYHLPLALVLVALSILASPPLAIWYSETGYFYVLAVGLVALLAIPPSFWLYVCALTQVGGWRVRREHLRHFAPAVIAVAITAAWLILPADAKHSMLISGDMVKGTFAMGTALLTWLMIVFWMGQSAVYLLLSIRRLRHYRWRLRQHFADLESRRLSWLGAAITLLIVIWIWFLVAGFASNVIGHDLAGRPTTNGLLLVAVWLLALCGIVQRPGFSDYDIPDDSIAANRLGEASELPRPQAEAQTLELQKDIQQEQTDPATQTKKYQRSALSDEQSARIADKIMHHMQQTQMYLQSDLTLAQLAEAINTVPHYVSQTLNDTMGITFFDFISQLRVEQAKLLLKTSEVSVTDVAYQVGFNARSSFYKAFKKVTGITPTQYRKKASATAPGPYRNTL